MAIWRAPFLGEYGFSGGGDNPPIATDFPVWIRRPITQKNVIDPTSRFALNVIKPENTRTG